MKWLRLGEDVSVSRPKLMALCAINTAVMTPPVLDNFAPCQTDWRVLQGLFRWQARLGDSTGAAKLLLCGGQLTENVSSWLLALRPARTKRQKAYFEMTLCERQVTELD
ncbi:hypothetical protein MCOR08_001823 [Pyricularia oryzae]|nr:hypothetical protein MCOR10_007869 [Pyricularia oryzae]KAI6639918.1 hypothetical protein MCOR08_001823 [Pyricularia oryzae]